MTATSPSHALTIRDLHVTTEAEPRILDVLLAERLGMSRPRDIRADLIAPNMAELQAHGGLRETPANPGPKGGRPGRAFLLNEAQALLVCMFSRTPAAAAVRREVIQVFTAWRRGELVPAAKPAAPAVADGKTVKVRAHTRRPPNSGRLSAIDFKWNWTGAIRLDDRIVEFDAADFDVVPGDDVVVLDPDGEIRVVRVPWQPRRHKHLARRDIIVPLASDERLRGPATVLGRVSDRRVFA